MELLILQGINPFINEQSLRLIVRHLPINHLADGMLLDPRSLLVTLFRANKPRELCCHGRDLDDAAHSSQFLLVLFELFFDTNDIFFVHFEFSEQWEHYFLLLNLQFLH